MKRIVIIILFTLIAACEQPIIAQSDSQSSDISRAESERLKVNEMSGATNTTQPYDLAKLAKVASDFGVSEAPEKLAYEALIQTSLALPLPVVALPETDDPKTALAQKILLANPQLRRALFEPKTGKPIRNEVMSIKRALPGDMVGPAAVCAKLDCYRIDIYNFFYNVTITSLVDILSGSVIVIDSLPETQPDLSPRLEALSIAIAKHEPAVRLEIDRYLKFIDSNRRSDDIEPVMAATKSALKNSLCERSKHLCVAPTYVLGNKALWVIVDLTDLKVAGLRWTTIGDSGPPTIITERKLENEYVFKNFCERRTKFERAGWSFNYHITSSDGLRVADVTFNDKKIFDSVKVVDWHVSYSLKDTFGFSDATGCPIFSSAVVVAYNGPKIEAIVENDEEIGFSIAQDFRQLPWPAPCNYRYEERYEFYNNGEYRVAISNLGRGCGDSGTYRPVVRLDLGGNSKVEKWSNDRWFAMTAEEWSLQPQAAELNESKYSHRVTGSSGLEYLMAPSNGSFGDGGRGDNAFMYFTAKHPNRDEGERDLVTLGACCNNDYRQGPEQFLEPAESLTDSGVVLWYVPQIKNDGRPGSRYCWAETDVVDGVAKTKTWPCTAGPKFTPLTLSSGDTAEKESQRIN